MGVLASDGMWAKEHPARLVHGRLVGQFGLVTNVSQGWSHSPLPSLRLLFSDPVVDETV